MNLTPEENELYKRTDEVLHYIWDPIGVSHCPSARDEYYSYLPEVFSLVKIKNKQAIIDYLYKIETINMGLSSNKERAVIAAEVLLDWHFQIYEENY